MDKIVYTDSQVKKASWPLPDNEQITSKMPTKTLDFKGNRYYTQRKLKKGETADFIMSVTTWLNCASKGIGFDKWLGNSSNYAAAMKYANDRALIGTMTHALVMYMTWGKKVDTSIGFYDNDSGKIVPVPNEVKRRLGGYIDFFDEHSPVPIATELSLFDPGFAYAGTMDQLMMIDGKLWQIDIKTGAEYPKSQRLQLTAYKILYDALYADITGPIDTLACLFLKTNGKYKLVKHKFEPDAWDSLLDYGHYHFSDLTGKMPKVKIEEELPTIYTLKGEDENGGK